MKAVRVGPLAMAGYELRQARKGATVVAEPCAGVWLAWIATSFVLLIHAAHRYDALSNL